MEEMTMVEKKMEVKLDDGKVDGNDIDDNLDENKKEDRKGNNKTKIEKFRFILTRIVPILKLKKKIDK